MSWLGNASLMPWLTGLIALLVGLSAFSFFNYIYPILDDKISRETGGYVDWMQLHLDRLFLKTSKQNCLIAILSSAIVCTLLAFLLTLKLKLLNFVAPICAFYLGWNVPKIIITIFWKRRLKRFDQQLIDALELMSNSIRSGLNLLQIIQVVVREMPNPLAEESQLVLNQNHLGVSLDDALKAMSERVPTQDLQMVINSILILRETGGNLSETFAVIAGTIRERRKVEGKIIAFREQALFQALFLFCMPFIVAVALQIINPGYLTPLFTSKWGYLTILIILTMQLLGGVWLKKLVTIDI